MDDYRDKDDKGEQVMKGKESGECWIIYSKSSPQSFYDSVANIGDGREEVGNDGSSPKSYLASGE